MPGFPSRTGPAVERHCGSFRHHPVRASQGAAMLLVRPPLPAARARRRQWRALVPQCGRQPTADPDLVVDEVPAANHDTRVNDVAWACS
jgi:hypothetical protein